MRLISIVSIAIAAAPIVTLPANAQITSEASLNTQVEVSPGQYEITGGEQSSDGSNLFHSFDRFDLRTGETANFITTPEIQNVLGRVTGGQASLIDGSIEVTGSSADLFLMNPAGIVFGENARLDVAGDFTATTASGIEFASGWFDAVSAANWGELTGEPIAFDFSGDAASAIANFGNLAVNGDANLNLFGGTVIAGGTLSGGNVSITAIEGGQILQLSAVGNVLGLEVASDRVADTGISPIALPELLSGGDLSSASSLEIVDGVVRLSGAAIAPGDSVVTGEIDVSGELGGTVQVLGDRVLLSGANIDATGERGGGAIVLGGEYRGGGTLPTAEFTIVDGASWLDASAIGSGDGGEVIVWADDTAGFLGAIAARGGVLGGDGGFVETSGAGTLIFRGEVDVSAANGRAGSLLLDPENIVIEAGTGDGATDGTDTFAGDPSGAIGRVLAADTGVTTIYASELEGLSNDVNVRLEATNDITLNTDLTFAAGDGVGNGSVTFVADSDGSSELNPDGSVLVNGGSFLGSGRNIFVDRRNLMIDAAAIEVGDISTAARPGTAGNISLFSRAGDLMTGSLRANAQADSVAAAGDAGVIRVESTGGSITVNGTVLAVARDSSYTFDAGNGGAVDLVSTGGSVTVTDSIETGNIGRNSGNGGTVRVESTGGGISIVRTVQTTASALESAGNAGDVTLTSTGGSIEIVDFGTTAGYIGASSYSEMGAAGNGGTVRVESTGGGTSIGGVILSGSSAGAGDTVGNGGLIEVSSVGGGISLGGILSSASFEGDAATSFGDGGAVTVRNGSDEPLEISGRIVTSSFGDAQRSGSVRLESQGDLSVAESITTIGNNDGGRVEVYAAGHIEIPARIDTFGVTGRSGAVSIGALGGDLPDRVDVGSIETLSYNGETEGGISISAAGDITLSGLVQSGASRGTTTAPISLSSTNGNISATNLRSTANGARPLSEISTEYQQLANAEQAAGNFATASLLRNLADVLNSATIEPLTAGDTPASSGNIIANASNGSISLALVESFSEEADGGSVALSAGATLSATTTIQSYSEAGNGGNIDLSGDGGVVGGANVLSYGNTSSGDLTIVSASNVIDLSDITTQSGVGPSGNITINGTIVSTGNVSSIAGTGSGDIAITATDGSVTTADITSSTDTGSSGSVDVTAEEDITTGDITSSTDGDGDSGDITAESETGSINSGDVTTESAGGSSGNVDFSALIDVILGNVNSRGGENSGDVNLNAGRDVSTGDITSEAQTGDSGDITVTAGRDITTGDIASVADNGTSGDVNLNAGRDITTGDITTDDGTISLEAGGGIDTGNLTTDSDIFINGERLTDDPASSPNGELSESASSILIAATSRSNAIATVRTNSSLNPNISSSSSNTYTADVPGSADRPLPDDFARFDNLAASPLAFIDTGLAELAELDANRTSEYIRRLSGDSDAVGSIAATREAMARVEAETGIRTGVFYISLRDNAIDIALLTAEGEPITATVAVDRDTLLETVRDYRYYLTHPLPRRQDSQRHRDYAMQLYDYLIRPIEPELEALEVDTLMLSLDRGLRGLPLAALYDGEQYLIERYSLSLIPSIGLIDTRYQPLSSSAPVLATGASQFEQLAALPAVPAELDALVQHRRDSTILLNENFTRRNLITERDHSSYPIVHLATHGDFNEGSLSNSYIQLWDEKIGLDEIRELGWHDPAVELLVLSACRTALGNDEAEMGFAGLAVAAGVKTAIASLWYVDDSATFILMSDLYNHLATAPIKAEALRAAQLALMRGEVRIEDGLLIAEGVETAIPVPEELARLAGQDFSHPYYWSAFTTIGAPW